MANMKFTHVLKKYPLKGFILLHLIFSSLWGQSISEKKANLQTSETGMDAEIESFLIQINQETREIHTRMELLYREVFVLFQSGAPPSEYLELLEKVNAQRQKLSALERSWRELVARGNRTEEYGLWHAPDTTLEQLIIDYGSKEYVYLIPMEVGEIRLSINSSLPIPRASWSEMLELILAQNGVGVRQLNPYLRQLYLTKENHSNLRLMTNQREDLEILPPDVRVSFVLSPESSEVRRTYSFLEKFINPNTTTLQALGRDILLIGPASDVLDLLRLNDFISQNRGEKEYRFLVTNKLPAEEMAKILEAVFDQSQQSFSASSSNAPNTTTSASAEVNGLRIVPLQNMTQALLVVGSKEEVRQAEEIIRNVESQIGGARDKVVFWYTVKHSEAEELADVLYRVYAMMIATGTGGDGSQGQGGQDNNNDGNGPDGNTMGSSNLPSPKEPLPGIYPQDTYYQEGGYIVNPAPAQPRVFEQTTTNNDRDNFIVDIKTGSIVMVVEADVVPKLKDLLRKLDVPKKMVQIETLLFEKILNRESGIGLNLLKIGDAAMNHHGSGFFFNNLFPKDCDKQVTANAGVTEFFMSRKQTDSGIPAFDLVYRFLLNQEDVQINSNPSLLTINQTPATIVINEEISINTGVYDVPTNGNAAALKDAFTRAQYGITISIKPTIHLAQSEQDPLCYNENDLFDYVTLETDITFDTINPSRHADRPDVTRRHITNQVQVPDGDTVILGGLRRKVTNERRESVPFLGELPGLGKLFSINTTRDANTEMFIMITPHIVKDPKEQLACLRQELLALRPGDVPYFLECVQEAHQYEKNRLMEGSMTMLFGRPRDHYYINGPCPGNCGSREQVCGEYDGR